MQAIANCKAALKGLTNHKTVQQMLELKKLVEQAEYKVQQSTPVPRVQEQSQPTPVPRVQEQSKQQLTSTQLPRVQATPTGTVQLPTITHRVTRAAAQKAKARHRHNKHQEHVNFPNQPPALSTRSKTIRQWPHQPYQSLSHQIPQNPVNRDVVHEYPYSSNQPPGSTKISIKPSQPNYKAQKVEKSSLNNTKNSNVRLNKH